MVIFCLLLLCLLGVVIANRVSDTPPVFRRGLAVTAVVLCAVIIALGLVDVIIAVRHRRMSERRQGGRSSAP